MTNFAARIAGVATLALAALPAAALTTAAHAQPAASVRITDLNLASPAGRTAFGQRLDTTARHFCAHEATLDLKAACEAGVRTEVNEKVAGEIRLASRI